MKKLTAGIFATLLAVVSTGAANAEIASKGYVDQQVGTKADATTVTSLSSTVSGHTSQIGTINTNLGKKADKATTLAGYGITDAYTSAKGTELEGRVAAVEAPKATVAQGVTGPVSGGTVYTAIQGVSGDVSGVTSDVATLKSDMTEAKADISALETASANHVVKNEAITGGTHAKITYDAKGLVTAGADLTADDIPTIPNTKVSGLGSLATKSSVATADIASAAVTKEKLAEDIVTSLGKADSALQKTTADATYAVKALESQVGTVSKENMGTTTATTVVGGVKEAIDAAKAADTKATNATSAASAAQSAVDAVELTIGGYGDIVTHDVSEFATAAQGTKADTAVQPAAISDMLTKTEAGTTYYTKTSGDALAGRVTTAEGEIEAIQAEMDTMATSQTVTNLTNRVTTAEGDITALETAVNDAESGLAATNAIADEALANAATAQSAAEAAQDAADLKLPTATYNTQVGSVSAANMGTTATTVVAAIKEVAGEAATAQSTANSANTAAGAAQDAAEAAQATANAAIPKPSGECSNPANKCVLTFNNSAYAWEVIARGDEEQ